MIHVPFWSYYNDRKGCKKSKITCPSTSSSSLPPTITISAPSSVSSLVLHLLTDICLLTKLFPLYPHYLPQRQLLDISLSDDWWVTREHVVSLLRHQEQRQKTTSLTISKKTCISQHFPPRPTDFHPAKFAKHVIVSTRINTQDMQIPKSRYIR